MKYAFIQRHRRVWPISVQCEVGVSVAGYHEHLARRRVWFRGAISVKRRCWCTSARCML